MIKKHATVLRRLMIFCDLCMVAVAFFLAYSLRDKIQDIYPLSTYIGLLPVLLITWGTSLYLFGFYRSFRPRQIFKILFIAFKTGLFTFIVFSSFVFIFKLYQISRIFIVLAFTLATLLISIEKITIMVILRYLRKKGYNYRQILIVGTGNRAKKFMESIHRHSEWGFRIIGLVDKDAAKKGEQVNDYQVLGSFKDIPDIIHNNVVDEVIFIVPRSWLHHIEETIQFLEIEGIKISVAVDHFELKLAKAKQTELNGTPLITFETTPDKIWQLLIKRVFDVVASGIGIIILAPLFALLALLIKATSKGPVFFRQKRCTLNNREFILYKFRTMIKNAEAKLNELTGHNEMNGPVFKLTNDPRLIKTGKTFRKFSIDELPQLWNVFKGDMSLVGPRPPIPSEVKNYHSWHRRRLTMRPGITCIWQVNGRNRITDFDQWMKLDLEYIDNWSLWLDFKILAKTIPAVLSGSGAK